ncbi:hypothetical protein V1514DRAFT_354827 [Lipomyces japonicus]|uniref:uncharacterized protein n=1 Tax=Lipomyces japonicus TaxID=56871 RepID=UPI0034D00914
MFTKTPVGRRRVRTTHSDQPNNGAQQSQPEQDLASYRAADSSAAATSRYATYEYSDSNGSVVDSTAGKSNRLELNLDEIVVDTTPAKQLRSSARKKKTLPLSVQDENAANERRRSLRSASVVSSQVSDDDASSVSSVASSRRSVSSSSRRTPKSSKTRPSFMPKVKIEQEHEIFEIESTPTPVANVANKRHIHASDLFANIGQNNSIEHTSILNSYSQEYENDNTVLEQFQRSDSTGDEQQELNDNEPVATTVLVQNFPFFVAYKLKQAFYKHFSIRSAIIVVLSIAAVAYAFKLGANNDKDDDGLSEKFKHIIPTYSSPSKLPDTNQDVVYRLLDVESKLAQLSSASQAFQNEFFKISKNDKQNFDSFSQSIHDRQANSDLNIDLLKTELAKSARAGKESLATLHDRQIESEAKFSKQITSLFDRANQIFQNVDTIQQQVGQVDLPKLGKKIDQIYHELAKLAQESALKIIEDKLPSTVAVEIGKDGKVSVNAEFWKYLKSEFATKTETESWQATSKSSWDRFIENNAAEFENYIETHIQGRFQDDDDRKSFVSKGYFLDLLQHEMDTVKDEFVHRLRDSKLEIENVVDDKISKSAALSSLKSSSSSSSWENLTQSAIDTLIELAIIKYDEKTIGRVDYADARTGARVNPFLTSATFDPYASGQTLKKMLSSFARGGLRTPSLALNSDAFSGNCWPFKGNEGTLAIRLSETIFVDEVAVDHIPKKLSKDYRSAPNEFEVYVEVSDLGERQALRAIANKVLEFGSSSFSSRSAEVVVRRQDGDSDYVKIGEFKYNIHHALHRQTFTFAGEIQRMLRRVQVLNLKFKFKTNWGSPDLTCIYKVAVHGIPVKQDDPQTQDDDHISLGQDVPI